MEKISSGNLYLFETRCPNRMKTFDFPQETISHTIRNPHSKALEPDCLCPWATRYPHSPSEGEGLAVCY